jgi:hypothetical protein
MIQIAYLPLPLEHINELEEFYHCPRSHWIHDTDEDLCAEYEIPFQDGTVALLRFFSCSNREPYAECVLVRNGMPLGFQVCSASMKDVKDSDSVWRNWEFEVRGDIYIASIVLTAQILDVHLEIHPDDYEDEIYSQIHNQHSAYFDSDGWYVYAFTEDAANKMREWLGNMFCPDIIRFAHVTEKEAKQFGSSKEFWVMEIEDDEAYWENEEEEDD